MPGVLGHLLLEKGQMRATQLPETCWGDCQVIRFGNIPDMPTGYSVVWHEEHEHYQAHGPNEWESVITVNRFHARWWAILHSEGK